MKTKTIRGVESSEEITLSFLVDMTLTPAEFFDEGVPEEWSIDSVIDHLQELGRDEILSWLYHFDIHVHVERANPKWAPADTHPRLFAVEEVAPEPRWISESRSAFL